MNCIILDLKKIRKLHSSKRGYYESREHRLSVFREQNRTAVLQLSFVPATSLYSVTIKRGAMIYDAFLTKEWQTSKIRSVFDWDDRPRIPWKEIKSGHQWVIKFNLSPYYMDRVQSFGHILGFQKSNNKAEK